jgi:5-methyltetrahydropteroyltriglutamate--homocysteine methyltransferase
MRFDIDVGGRSWFGYLFDRFAGVRLKTPAERTASGRQAPAGAAGSIMDEIVSRPSIVVGPVVAAELQYDEIWKTAQRLTDRPIKMGSCSAQLLALQLTDTFHSDRGASVTAFSQAMNAEYHRLADAGCAAIQIEEPCLHNPEDEPSELSVRDYVAALNLEVRGLRDKTEVWCHMCFGNPFAQRLTQAPTMKPALPYLDQLDVDVITFETADNGAAEIADIAAAVSKDKKVCIGVVKHRNLQVETPEEVAALIRKALKYIDAERLIVSTDCGFGRQGMSRLHAFYKMVAIVKGANLVRRELGLPQALASAADGKYAVR